MQVVALLSWFDEPPPMLASVVAGLGKLASHVVAFDGAYGMFPDHRPNSSPIQAETILRTADGLGIGCTIHRPTEKWWEGEVAKNTIMYEVGSAFTTPEDWFLKIDADEVLVEAWSGTRTQLAETDLDVAEITYTDLWGGQSPLRRLYRALPGIGPEATHYTIRAERDGQTVYLSGDPQYRTIEPALHLPDVRIIDRSADRTPERQRAKQEYYARAIPVEQAELMRSLG